MDTRRVILYAALALIVYSLWTSWHQDYPGIPATQPQTQGISNEHQLLPDVDTGSSSENQNPKEALITPDASAKKTHAGNVRVKTDVLDIQIDTEHGDIVNARLLDYPASVEEKTTPSRYLTIIPMNGM